MKRVLFLNDVGFQYGAGIAMARQMQSFLLLGHEVMLLCWQQGPAEAQSFLARRDWPGAWLGVKELKTPRPPVPGSEEAIINSILAAAAPGYPDLVVVHNIHFCGWPLEVIPALRRLGCKVVVYLHDLYFATGRCAYSGACQRYLARCDEQCPTPHEYPQLAPPLIGPAYDLRRQIFTGPEAIPLVANSEWTRDFFLSAYHGECEIEAIHFALDEELFSPGDKAAARRDLGIPPDALVVLTGAVNLDDERKGGRILQQAVRDLAGEAHFVIFGRNSSIIAGAQTFDLLRDPAQMVQLFRAADVFLGASLEEAFGQTFMEASACGVPIVAFESGGVPEIARDGENATLVPPGDTAGLVAAVRAFLVDEPKRRRYGEAGRRIVDHEFTLMAQASRWQTYLGKLFGAKPAPVHPVHPPEIVHIARPLGIGGQMLPSWRANPGFINSEHEGIYRCTEHLPGWQMEGDSYKLYEMGWFCGEVILEIGMWGGRSAVCELLGALGNPERKARPRFYGIDIDPSAITRTRGTLREFELEKYTKLFHGDLQKFVGQHDIVPTMVFVDGDHRYEGVKRDLHTLTQFIRPGVPLLLHDYANPDNDPEAGSGELGVRKAADEWEAAGHSRFVGQFGCSGLFVLNG